MTLTLFENDISKNWKNMTHIFFTYGMVLWCIFYFFIFTQAAVVQNPLDNSLSSGYNGFPDAYGLDGDLSHE